jgi:hypothetical protein
MTDHPQGYRPVMRVFASFVLALAGAAVLATSALAAPTLSQSERREVNRTINAFVLHAVRHRNASAAYDLVSSGFRAGLTRKEFGKRDPAYPFPARGTKFPWTLQYVEPHELGGIIMLQPRKGANIGPILFDIRLIKHNQKWVIDTLIPAAIFGTPTSPKVRSVRDFSPQPGEQGAATSTQGRISSTFAVVPFAVIGSLLAGLAVWGLVRRQRDRRIAASVRARDARTRATH